jgi:hypothetical protein
VNIGISTKFSANLIDTIGIIIHQVTLDNQDKIIRTYFFSVSLKNDKPYILKHASYNIVSIDSAITYVSWSFSFVLLSLALVSYVINRDLTDRAVRDYLHIFILISSFIKLKFCCTKMISKGSSPKFGRPHIFLDWTSIDVSHCVQRFWNYLVLDWFSYYLNFDLYSLPSWRNVFVNESIWRKTCSQFELVEDISRLFSLHGCECKLHRANFWKK